MKGPPWLLPGIICGAGEIIWHPVKVAALEESRKERRVSMACGKQSRDAGEVKPTVRSFGFMLAIECSIRFV
jgi:hypothetical protein